MGGGGGGACDPDCNRTLSSLLFAFVQPGVPLVRVCCQAGIRYYYSPSTSTVITAMSGMLLFPSGGLTTVLEAKQ